MIIYNITIKVELEILNDFVDWAKHYVGSSPDGNELPSRIYQLMNVDSSDGITYCLQHYFMSVEAFNMFKIQGDLAFREELADRYGDKLVVFASVLSEV